MISILAAFGFHSIRQSKRHANNSVSQSNLRQLGVAAGLYHQDYDRWPRYPTFLSPQYIKDVRIFRAPNDPAPNGLAHRELQLGTSPSDVESEPRLAIPNSYFGAYNVVGETVETEMRTPSLTYGTPQEGIFYDLSPVDHPRPGPFAGAHHRFYRLRVDLSLAILPIPRSVKIRGGVCFKTRRWLDDYPESFTGNCEAE
jgi:hypothetical protein